MAEFVTRLVGVRGWVPGTMSVPNTSGLHAMGRERTTSTVKRSMSRSGRCARPSCPPLCVPRAGAHRLPPLTVDTPCAAFVLCDPCDSMMRVQSTGAPVRALKYGAQGESLPPLQFLALPRPPRVPCVQLPALCADAPRATAQSGSGGALPLSASTAATWAKGVSPSDVWDGR